MRNISKGISLLDAISYRFTYSFLGTTHESICSALNLKYNENFSRQAYAKKENHIPLDIYVNIFNDLCTYYDSHFNKNPIKIIGIDGTYNRDKKYNEHLNMGLFDISNSIPIKLESFGKNGKNNEVKCFKKMFNNDPDLFKSAIIVADRAYFSYDLMKFLTDNNIKFIIRAKSDAKNLIKSTNIQKSNPNYKHIIDLQDNVRVIKCNSEYTKTIYPRKNNIKNKRNIDKVEKNVITLKNDCNLITNLLDVNTYSDTLCLDLYRSRWDIEVFFKFIKSTYKFSFLTENDHISNKKSYYCMLSVELIAKIISESYVKKQKIILDNKKVNRSNLIIGIRDNLLIDLINDNISTDTFSKFCKSYIKLYEVIKNRSYPRISKKPHSKWYVKNYSNHAEIIKIINAIKTKNLNALNKNLKSKAKYILKINDVNVATYLE